MHKIIEKTSLFVYKQFKIIWILFTLIFLLVVLYINSEVSHKRSYKDLTDVATNLSNNIDGFIEDLFQEVYTLPLYGKNLSNCGTSLNTNLAHITLNNPRIAGLTISNQKHQLLCSTLPEAEAFTSSTPYARTLLGPYKLSLFDQPIYLVQQKIGNYYIDILVVASTLKAMLQTSNNNSSSVALHNKFEKKNIISIQHNDNHNGWVLSQSLDAQSPLTSKSMFVVDKLQSIDGVILVVFENSKTVLNNLWFSEISLFFTILLSSFILYWLIKHLINKRYSLQGAIKLAIKNGEFFPEYQPIFDNQINGYSGVEILLRWKDNQNTIIMPDFFIKEAEITGLIVPITLQIAEIAFNETNKILKNNPDFHLAFNLSAFHFIDATFFDEFNLLATRYNILPKQIVFEITERELLNKNDVIFINKMQELRQAGFALAVDDYGTGHASISYLQYFPFNHLKIDKLFIQAIGTKAITESLNDAIILMAKELNLIIIAEGVETQEQFDYLLSNGVRFLQGWYFSKAVPIEKLINLLQGEKNERLH